MYICTFRNHRLVAGEGRKGRKLGTPVNHGHGRPLFRHMMGKIDDIRILIHSLSGLVTADLLIAVPGRSSFLQIHTL